jgi:phospholipid-binding lipoprotein MlaA
MLRTALPAAVVVAICLGGQALAQTARPPETPGATATAAGAPMAPAQPRPASADSGFAQNADDPWEPMNRKLYAVHKGLDKVVMRPLAKGYEAITNPPARRTVRRFIDNLGEPVTFINDVLQLKPTRAGKTFVRFTVNSTFGIVGLIDVAGKSGIPIHYEDFGQTLGRWGVGPGPYLFIPVVGPADLRDGVGRVVDLTTSAELFRAADVQGGWPIALTAADAIDLRLAIDPELVTMEQTATDEYATLRSAFQQSRQADIDDGKTTVQDLPDFDTTATPTPKAVKPKESSDQ